MLEYLIYFGLGLMGAVIHFIKKRVKGETIADFTSWIKTHPLATFTSLCGLIAGLFVAYQLGELTYLSSIGAGYLSDSFFNKWESKANQ